LENGRTSYVSEHTVEFYLVPRFRKALATHFRSTVAFYFWASREGSMAGRSAGLTGRMRLVAVYPRRPKLDPIGQTTAIKINAELFCAADEFGRLGVPVFAAFPHVGSLFDFAEDVKFLMFSIRGNGRGRDAEDVEIEVGETIPDQGALSLLDGPLTDEDICRTAMHESKPLHWGEAIEAINRVRLQESAHERWRSPFGPRYKPVYFLAW
jgi:hypothetical protein